jgi:hypothetical protein
MDIKGATRAPAQLALTRSEPSRRPRFSVFHCCEAVVLKLGVGIARLVMVSVAAMAAAADVTPGEGVGMGRSDDAGVCAESFIAIIDDRL